MHGSKQIHSILDKQNKAFSDWLDDHRDNNNIVLEGSFRDRFDYFSGIFAQQVSGQTHPEWEKVVEKALCRNGTKLIKIKF